MYGYYRGGSRISEGGGANNDWLAKKNNNWLIQLAIVCEAHSTCGAHALSRGSGHASTEIFSLFSIKIWQYF